ncbi:UvrD-helicase domain-containing protein [Companilactobacillus kimchii]|nr:UvrD-helicase domain-containing protein [Companilactobacillus kimchii]
MKNEKTINNVLNLAKNDSSQLEVIRNDSKKIVVEAPAGFGKTFTMINMIKYWIITGVITNYKKVLCLSFSVSAANRMKESIESSFIKDNDKRLLRVIKATNFHGLCRTILSKYGFLVGLDVKKVYQNMDSSDKKTLSLLPKGERKVIIDLDTSIKAASISSNGLIKKIKNYNNITRTYFLTQNKLPYNSIITLTLELLIDNNQICEFYQKYFTAICIDEFQDTNILGLTLIKLLTGKNTRFVAFGDDMQQIYQFLGAIPSLIDKYSEDSNVKYLTLQNNYRFKNNIEMQLLDCQLRRYKETLNTEGYTRVSLNTIHGKDLSDEALKISEFIKKHSTYKCAVLFSNNSKTTKCLVKYLLNEEITPFNALFR